ncbi:MAG: class II aldolase/adducin family protein [Bifidobacteriaceae bacterium]|jgi:L-fuculose-phosphate aldolase|nr:class II aldolase/adducin family protein [Bifidobacteriaceae bacterium]
MLLHQARAQVVDYCRRMTRDHLTVGTSGNVSIREGDLIALSPSGVDYDELTPQAICVVGLDGTQVDGDLKPSTEVPMHLVVYANTDAQAVVHCHPVYATALGLVASEVPLAHYMLAPCGGAVQVVPYALFGTAELASAVEAAMAGRNAVLLRNHGATTWGASIKAAYTAAVYLEWVCQVYLAARPAGSPALLSEDQFADAAAAVARYGQGRC